MLKGSFLLQISQQFVAIVSFLFTPLFLFSQNIKCAIKVLTTHHPFASPGWRMQRYGLCVLWNKGFRVKAPQFVQQIPVLILLLSAYKTSTRMSGWQKSQRMWAMWVAAWCSCVTPHSHLVFCGGPQQDDNVSARVTGTRYGLITRPVVRTQISAASCHW